MSKLSRLFRSQSPDLLGLLRSQASITVDGVAALVDWAEGDPAAERRVRDLEHAADRAKRELRVGLTQALVTPLDAEDLFELSRGLDEVMNGAKDTVREAEVMGTPPDAQLGELARALAAGVQALTLAFDALASKDAAAATTAADAAVKTQRDLERVYRAAMSELVNVEDVREVTARRELYRRVSRASDVLIQTAERVWYAVLKQA